jgi:hypothetical protein
MKRLATLLVAAGGLALMLVAFTPNSRLGAGAIIPATAATCTITHTPIIRIDAVGIVGSAPAGISKAMKEAEQGWQKAMDKIAERVCLTKGLDTRR